MSEIENLLKLVSSEELNVDERTDAFINLSFEYNKLDDLENSLKYAAFATITSFSPRADACCCMGDKYLQLGNKEWAIKWYESAINNSTGVCDSKYHTWLPLLKLSQVYLILLNLQKSQKYIDAAELFANGNEEIEEMKKAIEIFKTNFDENQHLLN